jgi:hypothetical protein
MEFTIKITASWNMTPCSLVSGQQRRGGKCSHSVYVFCCEDRGSRFVRNDCGTLHGMTAFKKYSSVICTETENEEYSNRRPLFLLVKIKEAGIIIWSLTAVTLTEMLIKDWSKRLFHFI